MPLEEMKLRGGSLSVRNLQLGAEDVDGIRALTVGRQFRQLSDEALHPVCNGYFGGGGEPWLLLTDEANNLYVMHDGVTAKIGNVPEAVNCAVAFGDGWYVMTESSRFTLRRSGGEWQIERDRFAEPQIYFSAVSHGTFYQSVKALTLENVDFSRSGTEIPEAEVKRITSSLLEAYAELTSRIAEAGLRLQPVLARAELLDREGRLLYASLPRLVAAAGGWQCCSAVSAQCTKPSAAELAVPSMMLSAEAYGVGVSVDSLGSFDSAAATLRVILTPQDHPVDFGGEALWRIVHPATNTPALTVALPGTTAAWADKSAVRTARLRSVFDRFDFLKAHTATVEIKRGLSCELKFPQAAAAGTDAARIERALAREISASGAGAGYKAALAGGFIAGCVAECGDTVVWGDITLVRALAAAPYGAFHADRNIEWSGTLRITRTDGTVTDRLIGYPDRCPLSLSALTAYPDADVKRIDVWVNNLDTLTVGHAGCELQPSADGTCSLAVTPDLQPIGFEPVSEFPETTSTAASLGRRLPGAVATAYSVQPLMPVAALEITPARISALAPAVRAQSLDAARIKLYAFSPAGIFNITLTASRSAVTAILLDRRGAGEGPVTFTPEGVYYTDSDGAIRRISGSRITRLPLKVKALSMAHDGATGRLLTIDAAGMVHALQPDTLARYRVGLPSPALSLTDVAGTLYLTAQTGLFVLADAGEEVTRVEYMGRVELPYPSRVIAIEVDMAAAKFKGDIALCTDGGPGPEYSVEIQRFDLDTPVNGPLIARIEAPSLRFVTVRVRGDVTPDFRLMHVSLIVCRPVGRYR